MFEGILKYVDFVAIDNNIERDIMGQNSVLWLSPKSIGLTSMDEVSIKLWR